MVVFDSNTVYRGLHSYTRTELYAPPLFIYKNVHVASIKSRCLAICKDPEEILHFAQSAKVGKHESSLDGTIRGLLRGRGTPGRIFIYASSYRLPPTAKRSAIGKSPGRRASEATKFVLQCKNVNKAVSRM